MTGAEPDNSDRVLVVASRDLEGDEVLAALREHGIDEGTEARLIAPAVTRTRFEHLMGAVDDANAEAAERIEHSAGRLAEAEVEAEGPAIGDPDPAIATDDVLREEGRDAFDRLVLVSRAGSEKRWAEEDAFDRIRQRSGLPVVEIELDGAGAVAAESHSDEGVDPPGEPVVRGRGRNMPPFAVRDVLAIAVAIVGTVVLVILAGDCVSAGDGRGSLDFDCYVSLVLAGAGVVINVPHVIGLVLFQSVGYRGVFEKLFSRMSLYGTPIAVAVSLIVG